MDSILAVFGALDDLVGTFKYNGSAFDPAKCSELSLEQKRGIVREIFRSTDSSPDILLSWGRRDLLEVICAEMGKKRKYSGVTKPKMIQHLQKLISGKGSAHTTDDPLPDFDSHSPSKTNSGSKKPRKKESPMKFITGSNHVPLEEEQTMLAQTTDDCQGCQTSRHFVLPDIFKPQDPQRYRKYKDLHAIVNMAIKKLKKEVGPLDRVSAKMARGIVNRLTCGSEVQKLCAYAIEASNKSGTDSPALQIRFEDISPVSIVVILDLKDEYSLPDIIGCKMWHRKGTENDYPDEPTCLILKPDTMFMLSGLDPSTEYHFKVSPFSSTVELGMWEARWVTQTPSGTNSNSSGQSSESEYVNGDHSSSGNEAQETGQPDSQKGSTNSSNNSHAKVMSLENIIDVGRMAPSKSIPPTTPHKSEESKGVPDPGNLDSAESKYEYCVKVIRWLECEGFMEKEFRVKFLTWFSLKATSQERRVVKAFIDVLIDEPESLVSQLNDAFMEGMCNKEKPMKERKGKVRAPNGGRYLRTAFEAVENPDISMVDENDQFDQIDGHPSEPLVEMNDLLGRQ
ncbi:Protein VERNALIZATION INSENSITIVE 3 [Acorus calamus]|uniref:Protein VERNALIZATION INSENSITIVE 3 n=1 Tax=Acorus calamus TaxID=4465 RepID=A0AAV9DFY3_ACOCL|nr:Protein VERNALIZATION INSENSITIVE 3 [Acorus calamus]